MMRKKNTFISLILLVLMIVVGFLANIGNKAEFMTEVQAATTLQNPRIVSDPSMEAGQKVTWDCIWFGSYPQIEVKGKKPGPDEEGGYTWLPIEGEYEFDDDLYQTLVKADDWDDKGYITIKGEKYLRISKEDATYSEGGEFFFDWDSDPDVYHYFHCQPIKWRVLNTYGDSALLLADIALDVYYYHNKNTDITWENSSIREFLNNDFIHRAFSKKELKCIQDSELENPDNPTFGTQGGNNTKDKVFLLSVQDVCTDKAKEYGFNPDPRIIDEAKYCYSSSYAKIMGAEISFGRDYDGSTFDRGKIRLLSSKTEAENTKPIDYLGCCTWWLRSPGEMRSDALYIQDYGKPDQRGLDVHYDSGTFSGALACRPAMRIDLTSSDLYHYAGTVCSDGKKNEIGY